MAKETQKQFLARLAAQEHRQKLARLRRIVRGLQRTGTDFHDAELSALEAIVERGYGRVQLSR
jgi:hypothetical protein